MPRIIKPIIVVQGGQYGSEAKGAITGHLCQRRGVDIAVRTGSINAGHTVYYRGRGYAFQQLPVGWVNPATKLVLGPGAYVHLPTLESECTMIDTLMGGNVRERIYIDHRAGLHLDSFGVEAKLADRHTKIGATGKGCAEAIIAKIRDRGTAIRTFKEYLELMDGVDPHGGWQFVDTPLYLNDAYDAGRQILLEGTQGSGLDLHLGPYPFTTSRQTTAAAWVTEAGLSPSLEYEVVLVLRTYPIRVAGNSGPMEHEISWVDLAHEINVKREVAHMAPLVGEVALLAFEEACRREAVELGLTPNEGIRMHAWADRGTEPYLTAASVLHQRALARMPPDLVSDLRRLFEMTTVTRKLRRIARFDARQAIRSIRLERPAKVALTFLNYEHPEVEGLTRWSALPRAAQEFIWDLSDHLDSTPIDLVSTGPGPEHIIDTWRS